MQNGLKQSLALAAVGLAAMMSAHADVSLNGLFTDHRVLQRAIPVAVYGAAESGEKVTLQRSVEGVWASKQSMT
jgi:hypothetical protein